MATVTASGKNVLGESWTKRYTYTITNYDNRAVITFTKAEGKLTSNPFVDNYEQVADSIFVQYQDSSHSTASININYSKWTAKKNTFVTFWSGSRSITTYKEKTQSTVDITDNVTASINIAAATAYTITYNANGGTGAPAAGTKYYGYDYSLSYGTPTRTGYSFVDWVCSSDGKHYKPGATYKVNAAATMTAQWTPQTYYINYYNNGGNGTIERQSKTYDNTAYFSNGAAFSKMDVSGGVKRHYELLHWNTNSDGSGTSYALNSEIPNISANLSVYAIWGLKYLAPTLDNLQSYRTATPSISDTDRADSGTYIYISFDFIGYSDDAGATYKAPSCSILIDEDEYTPTLTLSTETGGTCVFKANTEYDTDNPHNIVITLLNPNYTLSNCTASDYITTSIYPIDLFDNGEYREVYMGIMHPYTRGVPLTLPNTLIHGALKVGMYSEGSSNNAIEIGNGTPADPSNTFSVGWDGSVVSSGDIDGVDITASGNITSENAYLALDTTATSGTDKEIYDALVALGWDDDVIV